MTIMKKMVEGLKQNPDPVNKEGETPLHCVCKGEQDQTIALVSFYFLLILFFIIF